MEEIIRTNIENQPYGIFAFLVLGFLFIILLQNIIFYVYHKDKTYFWYFLYVLFLIIDQMFVQYNIYSRDVYHKYIAYIDPFHFSLEWIYSAAYIIFVTQFGGFYDSKKTIPKIIKYAVFSSLVFLLILFTIDILYLTDWVKTMFVYVQLPLFFGVSLLIFHQLFKLKTEVKPYILLGSLSYTIFSFLGLAIWLSDGGFILYWNVFYIGVVIENVLFSLGLVIKQKAVLKERNLSQKKLIKQLKENEKLKTSLTEELQKKVAKKAAEIIHLNKKAEKERRKKIAVHFEKEKAELRVSSLQSQMNPHFLFNSLNSIKLYIIKNEKENAVYYLNKFSKLIRKILFASREKVVSLEEELDTLQLYASIENIRFNKEINIHFFVDEDVPITTIQIPPLILQPFVENAIWHGLSPKDGQKKLTVTVSKKEHHIQISIEDNGIGRAYAQRIKEEKLHKKKSVGLKITKERFLGFEKEYTHKHRIEFIDLFYENKKPKGTKVLILVPFS